MPEDEPQPLGERIEPASLRIMRPNLPEQYLAEKERRRTGLKTVETRK